MDNRTGPPAETKWYSSQEVAEQVGVGVQTVHRWIKRGQLPAIFIGGRTGYRISEEAVEALLLSRKVDTTARDELAGKNVR